MYNFDVIPDRIGSDSVKWKVVSEDVIPMWVADMDLPIAPEIKEAVIERAAHPYYGYPYTQDSLKKHVINHYKKLYNIEIREEWIVWVQSVIPGVVNALQMMGGTFMYSVPMYNHIRTLNAEAKLPAIEVSMKKDENYYYTMDIDALEKAITPEVRCLILCNPHNPVGRVYKKEELIELQKFCSKHHLLVISDEIHCELDMEGRHIPFFAVNEAAANYSVTLSSAGKICNIPGLPMGFAIIPNDEVRANFVRQQDGLQPCANLLTLAAYEKAFDGSCDAWKDELRTYLKENRDIAESYFREIPEIKTPHNEGTYLLWLDCTAMKLDNPAKFFLKEAQVKLSEGEIYGENQYVRLNYGCPRKQLLDALERMKKAIDEWRKD